MRKSRTKRAAAPARAPRRKIDPRLKQALNRAAAGATIDAVILFRDTGKIPSAAGKSKPEQAVEELARTEQIEYNFFPNLGAVAVRTTRRALKKLLDLPDVTTATVNEMTPQ